MGRLGKRLKDYTSATLPSLLVDSERVLVHFGTDWCTPCKRLERVLIELISEGKLAIPVAKVNVEDEPELAKNHGVTKNPTLCLFINGELRSTHLGLAEPQQVMEFIATP